MIEKQVKKLKWHLFPPGPGEFLCQVCMENDATHEVKFIFGQNFFNPKVCLECSKFDMQTIIKKIKG